MAVRTISVTSSAAIAAGSNPNGFGDDVTIFNVGSATAYLDSDPPDSTTAGQPLTAGSSCVWTKGQPLWTIAPTPTTLTVSENSGAVFDAGGIASQILAQGLAAQIATAINVAGVPAIDSATVLLNSSAALPAATTISYGSFDCSRYQSLRIASSETFAGAIQAPRAITVLWFADAVHSIFLGQDTFNVPMNFNFTAAQAIVAVPTRGPFAQITGDVSAVASTSGVVVVGSYRPVQALQYLPINMGGFSGSSGFVAATATGAQGGTFSMSANMPVGAATDYPILPAGDATVSLTIGVTTGNCDFNIRDLYNGRYVYRRLTITSANTQSFTEKITLPNSLVSAGVTIAGGVTNVNFSIISAGRT